jgi:hypothetical protein
MPGQLTQAAHAVDQRRARSKQKKLGASDVGTCRRRAGYALHGVRATNSEPKMAAIIGTWIHKGALHALQVEYGCLTEQEVENPVLKGHVDRIDVFTRDDFNHLLAYDDLDDIDDPLDRYTAELLIEALGIAFLLDVEDLKTRSIFVMDRVREFGARRSEWYQVHLYADLLRMGAIKKPKGILRFVNPHTMRIRNVSLRFLCRDNGEEEVITIPYSQEIADEAWRWLDEVLDSQAPEFLPRDHSGPATSAVCRSCPFLDLCWPEREDGRPREALDPGPEAIAAVAEYAAQRAISSEADKRKKEIREQLEGLPPGVYGDNFLGWGGSEEPKPKPDMEVIRKAFEELGEGVPMKLVESRQTIQVRKPKDSDYGPQPAK